MATTFQRPMPWKAAPFPFVYEINTWPWLRAVARAEGRPIDLASVPDRYWDDLHDRGYDAVWLMGVWQRSPAGISIALRDEALVASFSAALPDYRPVDVVGSPYCIRDYVVDANLGGPRGLAAARAQLARRGIGLILDFVPNHVAIDHEWTSRHPERFVRGSPAELDADPTAFIAIDGQVIARGRDPFFPPWPDVVQLNAYSRDLREAVIGTLNSIARQCDGVRCDMAMLVMNDIFERTWGSRAGARPEEDYWRAVIPAVRETHPDFIFIAEAYWDREWDLQQQGFDYCYDKRLYDRLVSEGPEQVRLHLLAGDDYQARLIRFVENHDEPRLASVVEPSRQRVVTIAALTQTGARLVHHGQDEGRGVHLPVFLGRFPDEAVDEGAVAFYGSLMSALRDSTFRHGRWQLCETAGWDDRFRNLVSWSWAGETRWLIVVNLSDATSAGHVRVPWDDIRGEQLRLVDPTVGIAYDRAGDDLLDGLYVELAPWSWHLFRVERRGERDVG